MIEINSITHLDCFKKLEPVWNILLARSSSNTIFSTFEWFFTRWDHFGEDKKIFILLAQDGEEFIGIALLMIEKRRILRYVPVKVLSFIGTGLSDHADFIIGRSREELLKGIIRLP